MSEYVRLSDAVNKAVTTCDIGLADDLRKELAPKRHDERYALLLKILDNVPDTPPEPQKQPVANLPDAPTPGKNHDNRLTRQSNLRHNVPTT